MNVSHTLQDINFEWDDNKADENFWKHGISFETACEVFFDPFFCVGDAGIVDDEVREAVIGLTVDWRLLYVVYVMREDDVVRIISARTTTKTERKMYENR